VQTWTRYRSRMSGCEPRVKSSQSAGDVKGDAIISWIEGKTSKKRGERLDP
jgi:hypothetical protein